MADASPSEEAMKRQRGSALLLSGLVATSFGLLIALLARPGPIGARTGEVARVRVGNLPWAAGVFTSTNRIFVSNANDAAVW